jgi:ATP-dependent RNA helicase DeaD
MHLLLEGVDVIGQAQTGTGKTAAYCVPLLMKVDPESDKIQGLIITPTRELAQQVFRRIRRFARYTKINVLATYGGEKISKQVSKLEEEVHVIVGTPGRLIDLFKRRVIDLRYVKVLVVDEADKLLEMGFVDDVGFIISKLPFVRQTSLWSATLDEQVIKFSNRYMRYPQKVLLSSNENAQPKINQYYTKVETEQKTKKLMELLNKSQITQAIIFCNTRKSVDKVTQQLTEQGIPVRSLHGGHSQSKRNDIMNSFRRKTLKFLIATDVASRGLDIKDVSHIINFDTPNEPDTYIHRIGRTGRMDKTGISITFVSDEDEILFTNIINLPKMEIKELISDK